MSFETTEHIGTSRAEEQPSVLRTGTFLTKNKLSLCSCNDGRRNKSFDVHIKSKKNESLYP